MDVVIKELLTSDIQNNIRMGKEMCYRVLRNTIQTMGEDLKGEFNNNPLHFSF